LETLLLVKMMHMRDYNGKPWRKANEPRYGRNQQCFLKWFFISELEC